MSEKENNQQKPHNIAIWAALYAFFANLLALKAATIFFTDYNTRIGIGALITSLVVAGGVYAKQRLDEARAESNGDT